jgi:guanylate kinase
MPAKSAIVILPGKSGINKSTISDVIRKGKGGIPKSKKSVAATKRILIPSK